MTQMIIEVLSGAAKTLILILSLALIPLLWNIIRYIYKRVSLFGRLKACCRRCGAGLIPNHTLWMFRTKRGRKCDFYIETDDSIYSAKLWDNIRHRTELHFTSDGQYYTRSFFSIPTKHIPIGAQFDSKKRPVPSYEMRPNSKDAWQTKQFTPVLLINPVCREIKYLGRNGVWIICDRDVICGFSVYSLSGLLGELESQMVFSSECSTGGADVVPTNIDPFI